MKKSLFLAMTAVALLSGCSKDDGGIISDGGNGNESGGIVIDPDAVMIQLGSKGITPETAPQSQTRAAIDAWNDTPVGIYGVAKAGVTTWTEADNSLILDNASATIAKDATAVVFANNQKYYYPMQNIYNYSFYGYYPYAGTGAADTTAPTNNGTTITKEFTIDGTQDILWGMAATDPQASTVAGETGTYDGYNAKFFRKTAGATPNLTFKHALTRLTFGIVKGDGYDTAQGLKVTGIKIINVPTTAILTIADLNNLKPTVPLLVSGTDKTGTYSLKNPDGSTLTAIEVNNAGTTSATSTAIGESIMLPADAMDTADNSFTAEITLSAAAGIFTGDTYTSTVKIKLVTGTFEAGKSYKINLTVYSLSEIKLEATLTPWDTKTTDTDIEIN